MWSNKCAAVSVTENTHELRKLLRGWWYTATTNIDQRKAHGMNAHHALAVLANTIRKLDLPDDGFHGAQIKEYMAMDIKDDDIVFVADISFPGFFCGALYHKKPKKAFAYCHATSINKFDYFENVSDSKFLVETAHSRFATGQS